MQSTAAGSAAACSAKAYGPQSTDPEGKQDRTGRIAASPDVIVPPAAGGPALTDGASVQLAVNSSQRQACKGWWRCG